MDPLSIAFDGAGIAGAEKLCRHDVAWYAHRLGSGRLGLLGLTPEWFMSILAESGPAAVIDRVRLAEAHHAVLPNDASVGRCTNLNE